MQSMNNQIDTQLNLKEDNVNELNKNGELINEFNNKNESNETIKLKDKTDLILDVAFQSNFPQLEEIDDFVEDIKTKFEDDIDQDWLMTFLDETNKKGLQTAKRTYYKNKLKFDTELNPQLLESMLLN